MLAGLLIAIVALFFAVWIFAALAIVVVIGLIIFYVWWFFFKRKMKKKFSQTVEVIEIK